MSRRVVLVFCVAALSAAAAFANSARAAGECESLRVCLPVAGPWVVVPAGGVDYELACPLAGYVVGGNDARVAAKDVDVSFRGELGSPVGPGVTTRRSLAFHAARTQVGSGVTSFRPFIGCIPTRGGGGRALTAYSGKTAVHKPSNVVFSVVVNASLGRRAETVRVACPTAARLVGSTAAVAFRQPQPPTAAQLAAVHVSRAVVNGVVVARVTTSPAVGRRAEIQLRAVCARTPQ